MKFPEAACSARMGCGSSSITRPHREMKQQREIIIPRKQQEPMSLKTSYRITHWNKICSEATTPLYLDKNYYRTPTIQTFSNSELNVRSRQLDSSVSYRGTVVSRSVSSNNIPIMRPMSRSLSRSLPVMSSVRHNSSNYRTTSMHASQSCPVLPTNRVNTIRS